MSVSVTKGAPGIKIVTQGRGVLECLKIFSSDFSKIYF